jgi:hypothetical protein
VGHDTRGSLELAWESELFRNCFGDDPAAPARLFRVIPPREAINANTTWRRNLSTTDSCGASAWDLELTRGTVSEMTGLDQPSSDLSKTSALGDSPRLRVSPWWRILAVALSAVLLVIGLSVTVFEPPSSTTVTKVDWFGYEVTGGAGDVNNYTEILGMCAPPGSITVGIFSMVWASSMGRAVQNLRLWTLLPPNSSYPEGVVDVLYESFNSSAGGTSFLSLYPNPCSLPWVLDVQADQPVTVTAIATLTFNYTTPVHPI